MFFLTHVRLASKISQHGPIKNALLNYTVYVCSNLFAHLNDFVLGCGKSLEYILLFSTIFKTIYNKDFLIIESTATGAVEMMAENSLTFLPLDDPKKEVNI
jgi:hypothetical protein